MERHIADAKIGEPVYELYGSVEAERGISET